MTAWERDREPMQAVDAAWLRMEHPTNLMVITGVLTFDGSLDFRRLKELLEDRLLVHDRFRQRVAEPPFPGARPAWVEDDHFALRSHLHRVGLPAPGDRKELQELVSDLMSTPLDRSRPLWQMHLVDGYRGGTALVVRIHHAVADGIALVRLLFSLTDEEPDIPSVGVRPAGPGAPAAARGAAGLVGQGMEALLNPARLVELARRGVTGVDVVRRLLALPPDPRTVFHGPLGVPKRAAWSEPLPLEEIKAAGKRHGATINDTMLAAVSGALRGYLVARGEPVDGISLRAVVPVNLRPVDGPLEMGNRFGLVFLDLPVGVPGPMARLAEVHRRMGELKASPQAGVVFGVLGGMGLAGREIERIGVSIFASKATMVLTNVPGPRKRIYLAGAPVRSILFWVPQSGRLALGISIFSYAGTIRVGIAVDAGLVPDPETIVAYLHREVERLLEGREED